MSAIDYTTNLIQAESAITASLQISREKDETDLLKTHLALVQDMISDLTPKG